MSGQDELGITLAKPAGLERRIGLRLTEIAEDAGDKLALVLTGVAAKALADLFEAELARLNAIVDAARYFAWPDGCTSDDCDHDDGVCAHLQVCYATADDAIKADRVSLLKQENETLARNASNAFALEQAVAKAVDLPISSSTGELIAAVARLARERDELQAETDAVTAERDKLANDLGDLHLIHGVTVENEDALRTAGRRIAGLFNRDPEDHQVAGVLGDVAEQLVAWRTDPTRVPDGWQSLVRKGWHVESPDCREGVARDARSR